MTETSTEQEVWKDICIPMFLGRYQVSSLGRVRSLYRGQQKIVSQLTHPAGYKEVVLYKHGKQRSYLVHRIVARAFHGKAAPDQRCVRHLNGILDDWSAGRFESKSELARHYGWEPSVVCRIVNRKDRFAGLADPLESC